MGTSPCSRRRFLRTAGLGAAALSCAAGTHAASTRRKPNVVFFLTDDQRLNTIAALGNPFIHTPNLDKLAQGGFVFQNAYCMGSMVGAVCLPSRTMILTGTSLFRAKDAPSGPDREQATWPRAMKEAGYATLRSGKAGNHPSAVCGEFEQYIQIRRHTSCTEEHTDNGIMFIRDNAGKKPFFLLLAYGSPHDPQPAPERYHALYNTTALWSSLNFEPFHPFDNGEPKNRDELTLPWPRTPENVGAKLARYYASITYTDEQIGRVLDVLAETGEMENTIVVFASDNGLSLGDHGLLGKQNLYEFGGMQVPLVIAGRGVSPGESNALVYLFDVYPTVMDLAGLHVPSKLEGKSLKPVIQGKKERVRESLYCAYKDVQRSIRDDRWKLIRYPKIGRTQLFDLAADPYETKDLAGDPVNTGRVREMMNRLAEAQKQYGDPAPLSVPDPAPGALRLEDYLKWNSEVDSSTQ